MIKQERIAASPTPMDTEDPEDVKPHPLSDYGDDPDQLAAMMQLDEVSLFLKLYLTRAETVSSSGMPRPRPATFRRAQSTVIRL